MTTPNIDLYLPKTYVFKRPEGIAYASTSMLSRTDGQGANYVYLPLGLSMVTVTATAMGNATLEVLLNQRSDYSEVLASMRVREPSCRLWVGQISSRGTNYASGGLYVRIRATNVNSAAIASGSVSVQITNFPPEQ